MASSWPRRSTRSASASTLRARARSASRLVVEVSFDHLSDGRIRHGAKVRRWRDDKPPSECTTDQLDG